MAGSFASLYYHLVFSTKERRQLLTPDITPRIYEYIGDIIRAKRGAAMLIGGMDDHLHILTSLHQTHAVADALRDIKANSTTWIRETFPYLQKFSWQEGYGAFTVSEGELARVKEYIAGQQEHHRQVTFQDEFLDFLHCYHIPYDERYIWL